MKKAKPMEKAKLELAKVDFSKKMETPMGVIIPILEEALDEMLPREEKWKPDEAWKNLSYNLLY